MSGADRVRSAFDAARTAGRAALISYFVAGRPSVDAMPALVEEVVAAGADLIELGVPFSDPLADGPVIRDATRLALDAGMTVAGCLDLVRMIRARGVTAPIMLMGYGNPLMAYGITRFCADAAAAGVDGLIIPDVPLEEADELRAGAAAHGLGMTFLITPLTDDARIEEVAAASTGFLYAVATTGTTGARGSVDPRTVELLDRARALAGDAPVAVGFGISMPEHVVSLVPHADGVIIGSALVALVEADVSAVPGRIAELAAAAAVATTAS